VPSEIDRPRRNIAMITVSVAASVVDRFAPSERNDSVKRSLTRSI
jgi:hypothetical protein